MADAALLLKCDYCDHRGFKLPRNLLAHVTDHHNEWLFHFTTALAEKERRQKRALDSISADHLEKSAREAASQKRLCQQNVRQDVTATRFRSQPQHKAGPDDVEAPELDMAGQPLTYHPNQVKSKTKRTTLGPRRATGLEDSSLAVIDPSVATGDDLEDVPEEERHSFDPRRPGFNPFHPFADGDDFKKAKFFIQSRMSDANITKYFNEGIGTAKSFQSPHVLHRLINEMEPALDYDSWTKGTATFIANKKNAKQPYFFRNLEDTIRFLIEQPCFKDHMTYAPVVRYSDAEHTVREYGEPYSAEYWAEEQVRISLPLPGTQLTRLLGKASGRPFHHFHHSRL